MTTRVAFSIATLADGGFHPESQLCPRAQIRPCRHFEGASFPVCIAIDAIARDARRSSQCRRVPVRRLKSVDLPTLGRPNNHNGGSVLIGVPSFSAARAAVSAGWTILPDSAWIRFFWSSTSSARRTAAQHSQAAFGLFPGAFRRRSKNHLEKIMLRCFSSIVAVKRRSIRFSPGDTAATRTSKISSVSSPDAARPKESRARVARENHGLNKHLNQPSLAGLTTGPRSSAFGFTRTPLGSAMRNDSRSTGSSTRVPKQFAWPIRNAAGDSAIVGHRHQEI